jgi:hypothetical protein
MTAASGEPNRSDFFMLKVKWTRLSNFDFLGILVGERVREAVSGGRNSATLPEMPRKVH